LATGLGDRNKSLFCRRFILCDISMVCAIMCAVYMYCVGIYTQ
jgi:hypothetical protein